MSLGALVADFQSCDASPRFNAWKIRVNTGDNGLAVSFKSLIRSSSFVRILTFEELEEALLMHDDV